MKKVYGTPYVSNNCLYVCFMCAQVVLSVRRDVLLPVLVLLQWNSIYYSASMCVCVCVCVCLCVYVCVSKPLQPILIKLSREIGLGQRNNRFDFEESRSKY